MKISLVEYDAGNLPSVERALARQGVETERAATPESIAAARVLILPGVGHFGQLMRTLASRGLLAPIRQAICGGVPLLGICLGLQALFASSAEAPEDRGLDILPGTVTALPVTAKLPHMGWNRVRQIRPSALFEGISANAYFYFAHSYAALDAGESTVAMCEHGVPFVAALERENLFAVQFHPEKSGDAGARVLANFVGYASAGNRG
ncbi:MAG TPA: imidazole glycerol phosphate synthase subunit HisH [Rugosimonospora sp.]|jgi:imidazole glycerol phosphate synthase glutamine amidotransferase subunit|nr:imidazole glycerol phosphate synthase subunit HisH [Rugosimonospora sp.]